MATKILPLIFAAVFLLVFATGFAAATDCLKLEQVSVPAQVKHDDGDLAVSFRVTNTNPLCSTERSGIVWSVSSNHDAHGTWTVPILTTVPYGQSIELSSLFSYDSFVSGTINAVVGLTGNDGEAETLVLTPISIVSEPELKITEKTALTASQNGVIEVENAGNTGFSKIEMSKVSGDFDVTFSDDDFALAAGSKKEVIVTAVDLGKVDFGGKSVTIMAKANDGTQKTIVLSVGGTFCKEGEKGNTLEITDMSIDNSGAGDDDEWELLDIIEIDVDIENFGDDEVKDIFIELGIFDSSGDNIASDMEFENEGDEEFDFGDLNDGDEDTVTFRFKIPADIDEATYKVAVKAYGDDEGEDVICTDRVDGSKFEEIKINRKTDSGEFIAFDNIVISPSDLSCGDRATITVDVYNVGDEKQERVKVVLFSSRLSINEFVEITSDMDEGDKETISFDFAVPQGLSDGSYDLTLSSQYDYSRGTYRESSDDEELVSVRLIGCSGTTPTPGEGNVEISASLGSDAAAGQELVVDSVITNIGSETKSFVVSAVDFESWATLNDISDRVVTLAPGASKDVTISFDVDKDASGEKTFTIEVKAADGTTETREVSVNFEEGRSGGLPAGLGDNALIWVIGIINVVLIILIIIVAVRISRR